MKLALSDADAAFRDELREFFTNKFPADIRERARNESLSYPDDVVTDLGKAHARDQTHVTRTNHGYPHKAPPLSPNEELL